MPDCDRCPIRHECEDEKERIMCNTVNDMQAIVWNSLDHCPLVRRMEKDFKDGVRRAL